MRRLLLSLLMGVTSSVLVFSMVIADTAYASFPGKNGRIVFASTRPAVGQFPPGGVFRNLYTMNSDGTGLVQLTGLTNCVQPDSTIQSCDRSNTFPNWSPDGKKIAFGSNRAPVPNGHPHVSNVYVMDADGSHIKQLTHCTSVNCTAPGWSPDGKKITFGQQVIFNGHPFFELFVMNANGTHIKQLTFAESGIATDSDPRFTKDGNTIISTYTDQTLPDYMSSVVFAINVDGSHFKKYTDISIGAFEGDINPTSTRIVFWDNYNVFTPFLANIFIGKAGKFLNAGNFTPILTGDADQITTDDEGNMNYASFSPDGKKLVIARDIDLFGYNEINIVDLKKSNALTPITNNNHSSWDDNQPDWQPLPNSHGKFKSEDE